MSLAEFGVSYIEFNPEAFLEITRRFASVKWRRYPLEFGYGYAQLLEETDKQGKPIYDVGISWFQTQRQRRQTLVHESVHIFWEEPVITRDFLLNLYEEDNNRWAKLIVTRLIGEHEKKVDREAKRFRMNNLALVERVYQEFVAKAVTLGEYRPRKQGMILFQQS